MKKLILYFLFIMVLTPGIAQTGVFITGTLTDDETGNPITNYPVTILSDSTQGWFYYHTVYTNSNGYYSDSLWSPLSAGLIYVQVLDCNQDLHQDTCSYSAGNNFFVKDFSICYENQPCEAEFSYEETGYLTISFYDNSSGGNGIWNWSFGDGSVSSL